MKTFTLKGTPILFKFYNWLMKRAAKRATKYRSKRDKYGDKTFKVLSAIFISSRALVIKYEINQTNAVYELILQNNYKEQAKEYQQTREIPKDINLEHLITHHHYLALKIE